MRSDFARYLCVLVSGFVEKAVVALLMGYVRTHCEPKLHKFVDTEIKRRSMNPSSSKLLDLLGGLDSEWREALDKILVDEKKSAINSVVSLRNQIAHGEHCPTLTYSRIRDYYRHSKRIVWCIADLCEPK